MKSRTQLSAYQQLVQEAVQSQRETIYEAIQNSECGLTRTEIEEQTGMKINVVTARVNTLLGLHRVRVAGERWNATTSRFNEILKV